MKPRDPLEKYEIKTDLPPRQRLKSAGEALRTPRRSKWPWFGLALLLILGIIVLWRIK